jgi:exosome complex exonuclease RRP6
LQRSGLVAPSFRPRSNLTSRIANMAASSKTSDFETFRANLQKAILETTNLARQVPAPEDLQYQRTLSRPLGKKVDQVSKRLLHITSRVLDLAKQAQPASDKGKKSARNQGELQEEDVIDAYQARIVNVTDQLLEQIDANLDQQRQNNQQLQQQSSTTTGPVASTSRAVLPEATATSASSHYNFRNAGDIAKPQALFNESHNNARDAVFKPLLSNKPHALVPLDNTPVTHENPESGKLRTRIPNPYTYEIEAVLKKPFPELDNPYDDDTAERMSSQMDSKPYTFVDSPEKLAECLAHLKKAQVVAIDLEHHELRTFRGVTCLMQVSLSRSDRGRHSCE